MDACLLFHHETHFQGFSQSYLRVQVSTHLHHNIVFLVEPVRKPAFFPGAQRAEKDHFSNYLLHSETKITTITPNLPERGIRPLFLLNQIKNSQQLPTRERETSPSPKAVEFLRQIYMHPKMAILDLYVTRDSFVSRSF